MAAAGWSMAEEDANDKAEREEVDEAHGSSQICGLSR